ncbi:MAG: hypothetical protein Q8P31_01060 [Bacillota bacterium]|nr:hypothetical protein [Bacillota bacterium]
MSRERVGPFSLTLTGPGQEGFANDCLVAGTRETVGFTFYRIADFDVEARKVQGQVSAVVWMPLVGARELYRQLGEALRQLELAGEGEVVTIDHRPKKRAAQ